jgi:hypothetical protein
LPNSATLAGWTFHRNWCLRLESSTVSTQSYQFFVDGAEVTQIAINNGAGKYGGADIPNGFIEARVGWNKLPERVAGFRGLDRRSRHAHEPHRLRQLNASRRARHPDARFRRGSVRAVTTAARPAS